MLAAELMFHFLLTVIVTAMVAMFVLWRRTVWPCSEGCASRRVKVSR